MTNQEHFVREAQKNAGLTEFQGLIDTGAIWKFEGAMGREAMAHLESGACFLPETRHKDYWGNTVPSRNDLQEGTKGTLLNSANHYNYYD